MNVEILTNKMHICKHGVSAQAHKAYVLTVSLSLKISLKYCIRKKLQSRSDVEQHNISLPLFWQQALVDIDTGRELRRIILPICLEIKVTPKNT